MSSLVGCPRGLWRRFAKSLSRKARAGSNPVPTAFVRRSELRRSKTATVSRRRIKMYYVYVLNCKNNKSYVGCTSNLKDRIKRHQSGLVPATKNNLPIGLICYFAILNKYKAFDFEKYLKSGSGRAFLKRHLI